MRICTHPQVCSYWHNLRKGPIMTRTRATCRWGRHKHVQMGSAASKTLRGSSCLAKVTWSRPGRPGWGHGGLPAQLDLGNATSLISGMQFGKGCQGGVPGACSGRRRMRGHERTKHKGWLLAHFFTRSRTLCARSRLPTCAAPYCHARIAIKTAWK